MPSCVTEKGSTSILKILQKKPEKTTAFMTHRLYFKMLETLGDNRDLQANLDEAKAMLTEVDVKKFASYNWGLRAGVEQGIEKGIEKGIEQGIEQGIEKGIEQGDIKRALSVAKKLLQKNQMSNEDIADITSLSIAQVEALSRDLMN